MAATPIRRVFAPLIRFTAPRLNHTIRRGGTDMFALFYFSAQSNNVRGSIHRTTETPKGEPIRWYTVRWIGFLQQRDFPNRAVGKFGSERSSTSWGSKAAAIVKLEGDCAWRKGIRSTVLANGRLIICDNADGYGSLKVFHAQGVCTVAFYPQGPSAILPHFESISFRVNSRMFDQDGAPIQDEIGW
jgi:hypothetical protein